MSLWMASIYDRDMIPDYRHACTLHALSPLECIWYGPLEAPSVEDAARRLYPGYDIDLHPGTYGKVFVSAEPCPVEEPWYYPEVAEEDGPDDPPWLYNRGLCSKRSAVLHPLPEGWSRTARTREVRQTTLEAFA